MSDRTLQESADDPQASAAATEAAQSPRGAASGAKTGKPRSAVRKNASGSTGPSRRRPRGTGPAQTLYAQGEPMVWLTGGSLVICLTMILAMVTLITIQGGKTFWPAPLTQVTLRTGETYLGEVTRSNWYRPEAQAFAGLDDETIAGITAQLERDHEGLAFRRLFRTGNFELTNTHFHWVSDFMIEEETRPEWALIFERRDWGRFYGLPTAFLIDDGVVASDHAGAVERLRAHHDEVRARVAERRRLEAIDLGRINRRQEQARLSVRSAELSFERGSMTEARLEEARRRGAEEEAAARLAHSEVMLRIAALNAENARFVIRVTTAQGQDRDLHVGDIVRFYVANQLSTGRRLGIYFDRWREFLLDDPREANTEGGVFPAIFGTVVMTLIMTVFVVPFGVLAALYLREYAKAGPVVSAVRIAVNNLAGVPSIVFGVFGLGFFCYIVGSYIDGGPDVTVAPAVWLSVLTIAIGVAVAAVIASVFSVSARKGEAGKLTRFAGITATLLWLSGVGLALFLIAYTPYFDGFYAARLPTPTFGKGGILWAAATLALLTLPVVIVATEEALAAVPSSMREGSYACGASKWQTIRRIVLPRAMPGIMTGMILAMARGAGEVAPLMLVGAVKLAPDLPLDFNNLSGSIGPIPTGPLHAERSFMHLGFHIFDVGFQSPNSEAAKPMVYTTTLLLIAIIFALNLAAIWLRSRLKRRFAGSAF